MSLQKLAILTIALLVSMSGVYANVLLSDQGGDVREISTGGLLALGNITITIYTDPVAGTQLYSQAFPNAINNGSWNVMITPDLQFGQRYWKDYEINGEDLDFDGQERVEFQSPLGLINNVSHINFSLIHSCPVGNAIRLIYANGSVECQSASNESSTSGSVGLISGGHYLYNDSISIYLNELALNNTIDARSAYSNGTGLELSGRVFSLITTCSNNQLLKWNNTALQWYCADDLAGSVDLANYALKNQSEIFAGNISTTQTGFFGFLGSLTQRITRLFVSDIDVGNNVQVAGNVTASKFIGDGSGLTNIPQADAYTHLSNFSDDLGNRGYTSLSNFTNDLAFINSSQIQAYNETTLINSVNASLTSRVDFLSALNASFNQTLTDSLYAANQWGYNQTIAAIDAANEYTSQVNTSIYNWGLNTFVEITDMISQYMNRSDIQLNYYNRSVIDSFGFVNSSSLAAYNDSETISSTVAAYNASWSSTYNATYDQFAYNQTMPAIAFASANFNYTSFVNNLTGIECEAGKLVIGIGTNGTVLCADDEEGSAVEVDPSWTANLTSGASADFNPFTTLVQSLGSSSKRWLRGWFGSLDITNNIDAGGNISAQYYYGSLNNSNFPTSTCQSNEIVTGIYPNGTVICSSDEDENSLPAPAKFMNILSGALTDTNSPAAERIVGNTYYVVATNISGYSKFRYGIARAGTNGAANAVVRIKYISAPCTTLVASSWSYLNADDSGLDMTSANRVEISEYLTIEGSATGDVCIAAFSANGDGALDPQYRNIWVELS